LNILSDDLLQYTITELVRCQDNILSWVTYQLNIFSTSVSHNQIYSVLSQISSPVGNKSIVEENTSCADHNILTTSILGGGGVGLKEVFKYSEISPFIISSSVCILESADERFKFVEHTKLSDAKEKYENIPSIMSDIPLNCLSSQIFNETMRNIAAQHGIFIGKNKTKAQMQELCKGHTGKCCTDLVSIFVVDRKLSNSEKSKLKKAKKLKKDLSEQKADISQYVETADLVKGTSD